VRRDRPPATLAGVLLGCCLLAAALLGVAAAGAAHGQAVAQVAADAAARHRVVATLVEQVAAPAGETWDSRLRAQWSAVWTGPGGTDHRGTISMRVGAVAGTTVPIWTDQDGHRTPPPLTAGEVTGRAVGQGLGVFTGLAVLIVGARVGGRELLDRSRSRRWAAEWARVEPLWTRSVS
jgi:hypothetical protein